MPYSKNTDLPKGVRSLPSAAQSMFRKIANAAIQQYGDVPEKVMAVAYAGIKKAGWAKDEQTGKWQKVKESAGDSWQDDEKIDAWLDRMLPDILAEADTDELPQVESLTEDDDSSRGPGRALEHASELLACGTEVLSEDERGFLATMISRLAKDTAAEEPASAEMDAYEAQGPRLAQEAYRALTGLAHSLEADGLPAMLESLRTLITGGMEISPQEDVTPEQAKECLEALKVWDLRMAEAGSRHASWEYTLLDRIIEDLKRLRGMTPSEQKAMVAEEQSTTPEALVAAGYRESAEVDLAHVELHESALITKEAIGSDGHEWEVVIIEAGLSKNSRLYPLDVLRRDAHLFEGCRVYAYDRVLKGKPIYDHLSDAELQANPQGYVKDLVGYLKRPRIVGSRLVANLVILPSADWLRANLTQSFSDKPDVYGLSIDAAGDGHMVESGGQQVLHVDAIRAVRSTDVVSFPAAGGGFLRLVAGVNPLAYEQEVTTLVESISHAMQTMHFRVALEDAMDEAGVDSQVRRRFRARLLAALPQ